MHPSPDLLAELRPLFEATWPSLPDRIEECAAWGGWLWQDVSTPFVARQGDQVVSHVGVLEVPLRIRGRDARWAGIHAVCTRPDRRGQGLHRALMQAALAWIDRNDFEGAFLATERPELFTRYGFQGVAEHRWALPLPDRPAVSRPARPLSAASLEDVALLRRLLRTRQPISEVLALRDSGWLPAMCMVLYHGDLSRFRYIAELDSIIAVEEAEDRLVVLDVLSPRSPLPSLEALCAFLPGPAQPAEVLLCAERLAPGAAVRQAASPDGTTWMVRPRGAWALEGAAAALPPLGRC